MIDTVLNLIFRCSHRHLTRPVSPISKAGQPHSQSYVVCLDCGKQFEYNLQEMRIGKAIDRSHDAAIVPRGMPTAHRDHLKFTLLTIPAAFLLGALVKGRKGSGQDPGKRDPHHQH